MRFENASSLDVVQHAVRFMLIGALLMTGCSSKSGGGPNHAPTATSAAIATAEDTSLAVSPSVTDEDASDTHTFAIVTQPAHGTASVADNKLVYTPSLNFNGDDSFTFSATDSGGLAVVGTATVVVSPVNDAPTATSANLTATEDGQSDPVVPSVTDIDSDTHTFAIAVQPGRGTASVVANKLVYTPDSNFSGADSFTFTATDSGGLSVVGTAAVVVTAVSDAPTLTYSPRAVYDGVAAIRTPTVGDPDLWDTFSFEILTQPANGVAAIASNRLTYTNTLGSTGPDSFTYRVTDSDGHTLDGIARMRVFDTTAHAQCTGNSVLNLDGSLNREPLSAPCTYYAQLTTRTDSAGAAVTTDILTARPIDGSEPKAIVVLIAGVDMNEGITGNTSTGVPLSGGLSFTSRTAQILADTGYIAIALDRPSDVPTAGATDAITDVDGYRMSVRHAIDILNVVKSINNDNLNVFLVGLGSGGVSLVANNTIATGIALANPVTLDSDVPSRPFVTDPRYENLQASHVQRPALVLWHDADACTVSTPVASQAFFDSLVAAGVTASSSTVSGGTPVTGSNPCLNDSLHDFMTVETTAVGHISTWIDGRLTALGANKPPQAAFATVATKVDVPKRVNLATLARDVDGDTLSYGLPYTTTTLGGSVSLEGGMATYTPPAGVSTGADGFVFTVTDGKGGVGAAVVTVQLGP